MFNQDHLEFIQWLENLETFCHKKIFEHREEWFEGDLELSLIENYFTSPVKIFKSGKHYLVRCDIYNVLGKPQLQVFDENEKLVEYDDINEESLIMNILEIKGIKCSSRSFQIVIEIKQMMKMEKVDMFAKCLIKPSSVAQIAQNTQVSEEPMPEKQEPLLIAEDSKPIETVDDNLESSEQIVSEEPILDADTNSESLVMNNPIENTLEITNEQHKQQEQQEQSEQLVSEVEEEIRQSENKFINPPEEFHDFENTELSNDSTMEQVDININDEPLENQGLQEIDISCDNIPEGDEFEITERKDVYYKMYRDARKKAKLAKELSIASYLEAKNIKNTYMLDDIDSDSEDDESLE